MQEYLGDDTFRSLLEGSDVPLLCALKSIPTYSMEASELPNGAQVRIRRCCRKLPSLGTTRAPVAALGAPKCSIPFGLLSLVPLCWVTYSSPFLYA